MDMKKHFGTSDLYKILELETTAQTQDGEYILLQKCFKQKIKYLS